MSKGKLIIYAIFLLALFYGFVQIFIPTSGTFLRLELGGFIFLVILALGGFIGYAQKWGERVFFFVFFLYLVNLLLIWLTRGSLYGVLLILALVGFLMSLPRRHEVPTPNKKEEQPHSVVFDKAPAEEMKKEKKVSKSAATFSPGKYVASARSNLYHEPKCEWAKKIKKDRRLWFTEKEEAWQKGFKAHNCS
ncbi:hypothetical protein J4228_04565 [Candidatus Woesearchaeota archaeon]|nr:hypothetical protein [Candidatus Woesearchaeota archaeon]